MALYSRHQLLVILTLVAAFGGGLAVDRWRRAHPDAVGPLERFDREERAEAPAANSGLATEPSGNSGLPRAPAGNVGRPTAPSPPVRAPKLRADPGSRAPSAPIDLNRATADELTTLPGIGPALAARIVEARERAPFTSVEDLGKVRGLGAAKRERLRPLVTVSAP